MERNIFIEQAEVGDMIYNHNNLIPQNTGFKRVVRVSDRVEYYQGKRPSVRFITVYFKDGSIYTDNEGSLLIKFYED